MILVTTFFIFLFTLVQSDPKYLIGNALDSFDSRNPEGKPYPSGLVLEMYRRGEFGRMPNKRARGRALFDATLDPDTVRDLLMNSQIDEGENREGRKVHKRSPPLSSGEAIARQMFEDDLDVNLKVSNEEYDNSTESDAFLEGRNDLFTSPEPACNPTPPAQLCPTKYNTTAPLWGISLTSGKRVTIVQKFPDLLQQVIFHECLSEDCDIIHGKCRQTFTPYLFLVIPLGPVTLTGQDYVMVESGCACQPKYSQGTPYDYKKNDFLGH